MHPVFNIKHDETTLSEAITLKLDVYSKRVLHETAAINADDVVRQSKQYSGCQL